MHWNHCCVFLSNFSTRSLCLIWSLFFQSSNSQSSFFLSAQTYNFSKTREKIEFLFVEEEFVVIMILEGPAPMPSHCPTEFCWCCCKRKGGRRHSIWSQRKKPTSKIATSNRPSLILTLNEATLCELIWKIPTSNKVISSLL